MKLRIGFKISIYHVIHLPFPIAFVALSRPENCLQILLSTVNCFSFTAKFQMSNFVLYVALSGRMFYGFIFSPKALPLGYCILGFQPYALCLFTSVKCQ